jgi:hypothetical protein
MQPNAGLRREAELHAIELSALHVNCLEPAHGRDVKLTCEWRALKQVEMRYAVRCGWLPPLAPAGVPGP